MSAAPSPILPVYSPPDVVFERGEGVWLTASNGRRYLDFIAGIAVYALGHAQRTGISNPPRRQVWLV